MKYRLLRIKYTYWIYYLDPELAEFIFDSWHIFGCSARKRIKKIIKAKDWMDIGTLEEG